MSFKQKRILMKTFAESPFGYCPLTWMFHSRKVNSKINHLQVRSSRIFYNDHVNSFEDLLKKGNSFKNKHENIQSLARELFKVEKGIPKPILCDIFPLRSHTDFSVSCLNVTHFCWNSLRYCKVWNIVPLELKDQRDVEIFKSERMETKALWMYLVCHICTV